MHWWQVLELPEKAVALASSDLTEHEMWAHGSNVLAMQVPLALCLALQYTMCRRLWHQAMSEYIQLWHLA